MATDTFEKERKKTRELVELGQNLLKSARIDVEVAKAYIEFSIYVKKDAH